MPQYPGTYSDARGREAIVVDDDGLDLEVVIRGVRWTGRDYDGLEAAPGTPATALEGFTVARGELCGCELTMTIPAVVVDAAGPAPASLAVALTLPTLPGQERERVVIALHWRGGQVTSPGTSGWFEDELIALGRALPGGACLRACISCQYSDYSPAGHGLSTGLHCFRNVKDEYLQVRSKQAYWPVLARAEREVRETAVCPEYRLRRPGTGYRG